MNSDNDEGKKDALAAFAQNLVNVEEEDKKAKKEILRKGIEEREKKKKSLISNSKSITQFLSGMREEADMSAFVGTSGKITSPKFRRSEFIELLAREVLLIGRDEFKNDGGIFSMTKLRIHFANTRKNWELRDNDLSDAVDYLIKQKLIPYRDKISKKLDIVSFLPIELSTDTRKVLEASDGIESSISRISTLLGWEIPRVEIAVNDLVQEGIAIRQEDNVYFPGLT